ncbi:putative capsular associated [Phaeomoniella chlamydospora]|uniref:Putative capsular associated n=1 Tax=Phaeomoniella chlamydospora TaxID=158046 RepID=A0A0G2E8T9_PHACM|nr:putative capsular associated [Phaeomoniella chlamydospora]
MSGYDRSKRRLFLFVALLGVFVIFLNISFLTGSDVPAPIAKVPLSTKPTSIPANGIEDSPPNLPGDSNQAPKPERPNPSYPLDSSKGTYVDAHPIAALMAEADTRWKAYEQDISQTFKDTVAKYRQRHGRHPPPGFKEWYKFARERNVHNIDDFDQIMDDLRPFWAIEPKVLRRHAAHMWEKDGAGASGLHIRNGRVSNITNTGWRIETFQKLVERFVEHLPDMDIAMNRLDQPRIIVPWEDMQDMLAKEQESRALPPEAVDEFTTKQDDLLDITIEDPKLDNSTREDAKWYNRAGKQYMEVASLACPPESPARNIAAYNDKGNSLYKTAEGFVKNFNLSSDLCTVGPVIQNQHGFLYSASSIVVTHELIPIFGECKVNVNSDILFPANMYFKEDDRYDYNPEEDLDWEDKSETMMWRGVTSGGVQVEDNWARMHRQRLVRLVNSTHMADKEVKILTQSPKPPNKYDPTVYETFHRFAPSRFAEKHTDVGFTEPMSCVPNCDFYIDVFSWKPQITLSAQFKSKFLIDVDGHSFSGRWRAFLQSKSLGLKATIFREWHDSRLFAWRHFVPVDNRYDDLYSLLTWLIGYGEPEINARPEDDYINADAYIPSHDFEGKLIANQGREWANKVLRREDIEVYTFRLLLEYGRIVDDNRDRIGYSGDGSELDKFDMKANEKLEGSRWGLEKLGKLVGTAKKVDSTDNSS